MVRENGNPLTISMNSVRLLTLCSLSVRDDQVGGMLRKTVVV
jgi:hypothetical protein